MLYLSKVAVLDTLNAEIIVYAGQPSPFWFVLIAKPVHGRPMFCSFGKAINPSCLNFLSESSIDAGILNDSSWNTLMLLLKTQEKYLNNQ